MPVRSLNWRCNALVISQPIGCGQLGQMARVESWRIRFAHFAQRTGRLALPEWAEIFSLGGPHAMRPGIERQM